MADKLIRASGLAAQERGVTAMALGAGRRAGTDTLRKIRELCDQSDAAWLEALTATHAVENAMPSGFTLTEALIHAVRAYENLVEARSRADKTLQGRNGAIGGEDWIEISGRFIRSTARLREVAFSPNDTRHEIAQNNIAIKQRLWTMSELYGQERGILAFYISAGKPVPPERLDQLKAMHGVAEHLHSVLNDLRNLADVDDTLLSALESMEREVSRRIDKTRRQVYAAAATGSYPVSAETWWETSTAAVDSILGVLAASSRIIEDKARAAVEASRRDLVLQGILAAAALFLAAISITRVRKTANALFHEKELAEVTLHSIGDAVITTDAGARVEYLNPIAETLTGWSVSEAKGRPLREVFNIVSGVTREPQINPAEKCLAENRIVGLENNTVLIARDGTERLIEDSAAPVRDREEKIVGAVMVFYDVTLMRNSSHLLSYHATHDALTGLVNRREFERHLTQLVENAKIEGKQHVLCYLDLDQFKIVNDTCGHIAGDKLLRQLTYLLKNRVRETDTLARLGGDEFGVLLVSCPLEAALRLADDLIRIVNDFRFVWEDATFEIGASIGMVRITPESGSPVELLSQADSACYAAKDKGRNRVQVYEPGDAELLQRHGEMQWVSRLRRALAEDRLTLFCQSIVPLAGGKQKQIYCETLVRMVDESGGIVPPMAFIPAAERYNLMPAVDRWVIQKSLSLVQQHGRATRSNGKRCFINLSAATLSDSHMLEYIQDQLRTSGVVPNAICFEITETAAVTHMDTAVTFMQALKKIGCRFALDDFGSGMSSFSYLKNLPVDYLKIDGAFVKNMLKSPTDHSVVDAINRVGHVMGIQTVAEFVENNKIIAELKKLGVDYAQGYGIATPQPMAEHISAQGKKRCRPGAKGKSA
jgi:diguanylate cyclase (GGDEF)-like protein/PAS domain S-box-containing protein